ncbi:MAG: glycosyltransferase family 39 protein [Acidobacteria bacterium]|nr:glycosyltransferase family 39 protein [Acidobacteriota bacterium]
MTTAVAGRQADTPAREARWPLWVALGVVAGVFLVRFPNIVQPMGPDQGVYATIGWGLQHDLALYRDMFEQKPPAIYLTYLLGFQVFGNHVSSIFWIDYLAAFVTVAAVFEIGRRLVTPRFGGLAAALVALATLPAARHAYGGFLERAVTETFITPLAALIVLATVLAVTRDAPRWGFAVGALAGLAFLYKQTALIYWPLALAWTWFVTDTARTWRFAVFSLPGVALAPMLAVGWLWAQGTLGAMWTAVVEYNMAYLAVGDHGVGFTIDRFAREVWRRMKTDEVWALGTLSAFVAVCAWRWRAAPAGRVALLGVLWLGAALTATLANGPRFFTTYFVPSLVPLGLLSAWLLRQTLGSGRRRVVAAGLAAVAFAGAMTIRSGSFNRAFTATLEDARHLLGQTSREDYLYRYRSRATRAFSAVENDRLASHIRSRTEPHERIFVFGMTAGTYFSSQRLPASRFLFAYPAVSDMTGQPDFKVETLARELDRSSPRYIVLQRSNGDSFSGWRASEAFQATPLQALVGSRYREETEIGDFVLYRRLDDRGE